MRLAWYSTLAVRLANTSGSGRDGDDKLTSVDQLRALLLEQPMWRQQANDTDLAPLRALRADIRGMFQDAAAREEVAAVRRLNQLLGSIEVRPRVTGHDGEPWHLHLSDGAQSTAASYAAAAIVGLATYIVENGFERLGVCEAAPCRNVFVDSSTNVSRRYCSGRCATRANVAAFRARQRAAEPPHRTTARPADRSESSESTAHAVRAPRR